MERIVEREKRRGSRNIMKFDINNYSENFTEKDGIFFSNSVGAISYPEDGNDACFSLEDDSYWFKHRNNCIVGLVKKYAKGKVLFDIGGGNGFVSKELSENGIETCLVEPGVQGCLNAKKRGLANIICSDMENAGFVTGTLPAVGLFDVIEHIERDSDILSKINNILSGEGVMLITVPAYKFLWSNEDVNAGHFRRYTLNNLRKKLTESGFEIIYASYIFSFLVLPIFLFRTIPSLLGIAKSGIGKAKKEHTVNENGIVSRLLKKILTFEISQIEKNRKIPFGGSCLVVAKKR